MQTVPLELKQASAVLDVPPKGLQNLVQVGVRKPSRLMKKALTIVFPSKARDLLLFVFNKKQQMLRYAQHDRYPFSSTC